MEHRAGPGKREGKMVGPPGKQLRGLQEAGLAENQRPGPTMACGQPLATSTMMPEDALAGDRLYEQIL